MRLLSFEDSKTISHRAILLAGNDLSDILHSDRELISEFNQSDKKSVTIAGMNETIFLAKVGDSTEAIRKSGAEFYAKLDKEVAEVAIFGNDEDVFHFLEGLLLANYQFLKYFTKADEKKFALDTIYVPATFSDEKRSELLEIRKAVFWVRDMVNEPVSYLNAEQLAEEIVDLMEATDAKVKVLEKTQIESLKMGGLLAVNQGSLQPPTLTIIEYKPDQAKNSQPIVLVGKGVVYDTGGLSLKPTANSMDIMKSDMAGAATVVGAIYLAAKQQLPLHIVALVPATDNRPGGNAYAPGDVIRMHNGKTVEVLNTDAEGRMILADALSYSSKYSPELVIDAATLTGAAVRAIGVHASVVMGNAADEKFEALEKAGQETHERVVRFPFWEEYYEEMKSPIADLKNLGGSDAGMITAGKFLEQFVEAPYIHMDIAGPSWLSANNAYRTKGGSGTGVRLLYQFLKNY